jgi:hypothetical protein
MSEVRERSPLGPARVSNLVVSNEGEVSVSCCGWGQIGDQVEIRC